MYFAVSSILLLISDLNFSYAIEPLKFLKKISFSFLMNNFLNKEYILAIAEYEKLTRKMGFSPFVEKARFRICEAYRLDSPKYYHDQIYTEKALEKYQEFVDDFPNSENYDSALEAMVLLRDKLAKKLYETGLLYLNCLLYTSDAADE